MQNTKLKNASKAIIFVLIFALISCSLTGIFAAKWYDKNAETAIAKHVYELDKDSIEVLLLGSSQVAWSVDTVEFYEKYGILTYAIGGSHNNLLMNYYWLLDTLKRQKNIKTVMVDTSLVFNSDIDEAADYMKNLQGMRWSKYKYQAIRDYYNKIETPENDEDDFYEVITNYFFTLNQYHSRWDELDEEDFDDTDYDIHNIMGFTPTANVWSQYVTYDKFIIDNDTKDESKIFNEVQMDYLKKIVEECKSRGIQCVLIKTPKNSWSKTGSDYIQAYADEEGLDFLECTTDKAFHDIGLDFVQDFKDGDHLNARGAKKLADYFCEYLIQHNTYKDARVSGGMSKKNLEIYHKKDDSCFLNSSLTPEEYLTELAKREYTIVLQSSADISDYWTEELQKGIEASGFTLEIDKQQGKNYITAVQDGKVVIETTSDDAIEDSIKVIPENKVKLVSDFENSTTTAKRQKPYSYSENGLRITVFDKDSGETLSRATIYNSDEGLKIAIEYAY